MLSVKRLLPALLLLPSIATAELKIEGVDRDLERNIRAFVSLATEPCDAEDWRVRRRFRSIETEARKALEPFGFYTPAISASLSMDDACWQASLTIEPGNPVLLRQVDVSIDGEAAADAAFDDLVKPAPLVAGSALRHAEYDRLKKVLQIRAADRGYVDAAFTASRLEIWPEAGYADVTLKFDSGSRYRIGPVIQEQDFLDEKIVAGFIDIEPGVFFDAEDLARAHRDLATSAYFSRIEVIPDFENIDAGQIPVKVRLQPGNRIEYKVGLGASTDTGARFRAGFRHNRLNRNGHQLFADLTVSPVLQGLTAEYRIPLADPRREWLSVTAALSNEETDTFDNEAQSLGLRWSKAVSKSWLRTLSVDASNESFNVGDEVDTTRAIVPGVMYDHKLSDRDIFPSRGRRLGIQLRGTDEALGSSTSYAQANLWLRWIRSFGSGNRVLARLNAGATTSKNFSRLPPSVRFFAGGDESIRGFDYESLGPQDADGNVVGGANLLVASVEYERQLRGNYYGAMFVDGGNAFDNSDLDAQVGAGLGIKWRSPIGPIRLYVGFPLTGDDSGARLHLRLGGDL